MDNKNNKKFIDKLEKANFSLDSINISEIELARSIIDKLPDVREDKVASIKEQIDNGTYDVSTDDFASKLLDKYIGLF